MRLGRLLSPVLVFGIATALGLGLARVLAEPDATSAPLFYAGTLEESGKLVTGERAMQLALWDAATDGKLVCETVQAKVPVNEGRFRLALDGTCSHEILSPVQLKDLWLELVIGAQHVGARARVGAVPYALRAERANSADTLGALTPDQIAKLDGKGRVLGPGTSQKWAALRADELKAGQAAKKFAPIPGLSVEFELLRKAQVHFHADGGQYLETFDQIDTSCHQSYRYVLDDEPLGDPTYGQHIQVSAGHVNWWSTWAFSYVEDLPAGKHSVRIETADTQAPATGSRCTVCPLAPYGLCTLLVDATYE